VKIIVGHQGWIAACPSEPGFPGWPLESAFTRWHADSGNRTIVPPQMELYPLCSHPIAWFW